jgi:hypothetical protein
MKKIKEEYFHQRENVYTVLVSLIYSLNMGKNKIFKNRLKKKLEYGFKSTLYGKTISCVPS